MFNLEDFDIKLDTDYIGRNFIYCDEVESTNSLLMNKENKFNINGTVALAEKQSKGKGRMQRIWYSAKDQNLTFSILLTDKKYLKKLVNLINFAASLSVAMAIENLFQLKTELKWPNDILINGKKTAGILLESYSQGSTIERLVIGVGLNVNQTLFQGSFNYPPTSIKLETNETVEREKLLSELLNIFEDTLFNIERKPEEIMNDWKARCRMIGEKISITDGEKSKYGIFNDIDENGFLLLRVGSKIEKIHFGEVSLG